MTGDNRRYLWTFWNGRDEFSYIHFRLKLWNLYIQALQALPYLADIIF